MNVQRILGIDPGYSGALACIHPVGSGGVVTTYPMPIVAKELDEESLSKLITGINPGIVVMEKVHAMPGNGVVSSFRFGQIYGQIITLIKMLRYRLELVAPQTWKAEVLRDTAKDKQAAIDYCTRAFSLDCMILPGCRKPSHDIADAICIAEYGRRKF